MYENKNIRSYLLILHLIIRCALWSKKYGKYLKCFYDNLKLFKYYCSPMKLRSSKVNNIMNFEFKPNEFLQAVASLNDYSN